MTNSYKGTKTSHQESLHQLEKDRANNATCEVIEHWSELIKEQFITYEIQTADLYNLDEKGYELVKCAKEKGDV